LDLDGAARSRFDPLPPLSRGQSRESVVFQARGVLSRVDGNAHSEDAMITLFFRSLASDADEVKGSVHHGRNRVNIVIVERGSKEPE
jgi:hypothetical protein